MADLISRQAAIDALNKHSVMYEFYLPHEFYEVKKEILGLPSAQQEIIRCKDCKYNDLEEQNASTRWLPCIDAAWPDDWFCGCAERKES